MRFVTELTELSGKGMKVLQNLQNDRVGIKLLQNSQTISGTGNTRVNTPGIQKVNGVFCGVRVLFVGYEGFTDLTELSGKGMKVLQSLKNCRVRV